MQGLAVLLEMGGLQVEPRLPEGEALRRELRPVRWEISASGGICLAERRNMTIWRWPWRWGFGGGGEASGA